MMLWFKARHDDNFEFKVYDLRNGKGQYRHFKFQCPIAFNGSLQKV